MNRTSILFVATLLSACASTVPPSKIEALRGETNAAAASLRQLVPLDDTSAWLRIRKQRIDQLLGPAMRQAGVDAWVVVVRENHNDPLAAHVGGENAGGTAAILFFRNGDRVSSLALSPSGEAVALRDMKLHDEVRSIDRSADVFRLAADEIRRANPSKIAINSSARAMADGLSFTQRKALEDSLGTDFAARLVPAEELVVRWLSVKLPEEVEILRRGAVVTAHLEEEAYATVKPGVSRDSDVGSYLKKRMRELGFGDAWAPDQNPNVNSGPDRGHSNATAKIIQPGDIIQTDFGINVGGIWNTDIQRFAYVLKDGEREAPAEVVQRWENGKRGSRTALAAMRPGVRGYDVDAAQRAWMKQQGSEAVPWGTGHPVGYWAHDVGPALSGAQRTTPPAGDALRTLEPGQTFAFDGFFCWPIGNGDTKTISVEEMAVVTASGAEYLMPPQEKLILIGGKAER